MASWDEFDPSLKDIAVLKSLALFGEAHATGVTLDGEDQMRVEFSLYLSRAPSIRQKGNLPVVEKVL